jgi:hypothetical protein
MATAGTTSAPEGGPVAPWRHRAWLHVALTGLLGVVVVHVEAPLVIGAAFAGVPALLLVLIGAVVLNGALAHALDRAAGPGGAGREASAGRGLLLGSGGTVAAVALTWAGMQLEVDDWLPDAALWTAPALPFVVIAALQWPGLPRLVGALAAAALVGLAGVSADDLTGPAAPDTPPRPTSLADRSAAADLPDRPWVAGLPGWQVSGAGPWQEGGVATSYATDDPSSWGALVVALPAERVPGGDPCAAATLPTPRGSTLLGSCELLGPGTWARHGVDDGLYASLGVDVVGQVDGRWVSVSGGPDLPVEVLADALEQAAPMTDAELDAYLTSLGYGG